MNMTTLIAFTFSYPERTKNMTALTDTICLIFVKDEDDDLLSLSSIQGGLRI